MLTDPDGFHNRWQELRKESLSYSTYSVVVFVSCLDVDAFSAAMMLASLLQKHLILYKTEPVIGYKSLQTSFQRLESSIRNVFLIGCGSAVDLEEYLDLTSSQRSHMKLHIFDCKRPWNLNNLFGSDRIYCYEDCEMEQLAGYEEAYNYLAEAGDEMPVNENPEPEPVNVLESDSTQTDFTQPDGNAHNNNMNLIEQRQADIKRNTNLLESYYEQGSHQSSTNSIQMYTFLTMIGETSLKMLWTAILGLTSIEGQYPHLYRMLLPSLQEEMRRLSRDNNYTYANSNQRELVFNSEPDYSLFLMRQWSLYESMIHSSYINAKLFLWREEGRKKLHKLLARIGVTIQDSKESWTHMRPSLKRELKSKLDSVSELYGIEGITRDGIIRQYGLHGVMSAGDCVESIAAILETGDYTAGTNGINGTAGDVGTSANTNRNMNDSPSENGGEIAEDSRHETWVRNFWIAWDAFEVFDSMKQGVEKAKVLQSAVVSTANSIFDKNLPKDLQSFRMVVVQDAPELPVFWNPLSLRRLTNWVFESCAELNHRELPMVFAVLNEQRNVYLVYGIGGGKSRERYNRGQSFVDFNRFGSQFQETATQINARIRVDAFDSAIIELAREDLPRFLEALDEMRSASL